MQGSQSEKWSQSTALFLLVVSKVHLCLKWAKAKGERKVSVSHSVMSFTLCDPKDCSPSGSSVHGILQARILEWVASPFSMVEGKKRRIVQFSSVQFSRSVMSDSLQPHRLQHTRLLCPSSIPGIYSNSCPLSRWCHPTISSSVILFSSHLQSFPASGSFPMSQFFTSGGQIIGLSASTSVLPGNIENWFPLGQLGWISL